MLCISVSRCVYASIIRPTCLESQLNLMLGISVVTCVWRGLIRESQQTPTGAQR